uniref:Galectin domain-containing protein n=1 Tax=Meloidogyne javanica TaxID=6303 RepID=A0A915N0B8_MELJA
MIYRLPENIDNSLYKYKLDKLQQNGTIFCFEAFVKNKELLEDTKKGVFEVNLFHDVYEFNEKIGETVLKLDFSFDTEIYNKNMESSDNQKLVMNSYIHKRIEKFGDIINKEWGWQKEVVYPNPLGQTGVNFSLRIDIVDKTFNIIINEAIDYISYETPLPIWTTEWIMVKGDIDNVKFGKNSEKCKSKITPNVYPPNIIQVPKDNHLEDGSLIKINGKIINESISISFLYNALEWHHLVGSTIFQLNFTKEYAHMGTFYVCNL